MLNNDFHICLEGKFRMKVLQLGIEVRVRQTCNIYQFMKYIHVHFTATYWACKVCIVQGTGTAHKNRYSSRAGRYASSQQMKQRYVSGARRKLHNAPISPYPRTHATCLDLSLEHGRHLGISANRATACPFRTQKTDYSPTQSSECTSARLCDSY